MPYFAFIYRGARNLDAVQLAQRADAVRSWTLAQRDAGRVIAVSVFDQDARTLVPETEDDAAAASSLAGCTIVSARDLDDAVDLARRFPGRQFGTTVEVCPVKTFVPPAAP